MIIQAEISLYPLREKKISPTLDDFLSHLRTYALVIQPGTMSTYIRGEAIELFSALGAATEAVLDKKQAVLIVKASNACPTENAPR